MPNYTYPGTDTVKNKLDAQTHDDLEKREARFVAYRAYQIEIGEGPRPLDNFNVDHLKALHRHLFQDVYEWAGHTRDELVQLSDGTIATEPVMQKLGGLSFLDGTQIESTLNKLAADIRNANFLNGLPQEEFAVRAADVMSKINAIHPFREGNGRAQRAFMRELAKQAGHDLDFSVISRERMFLASVASHEYDDFSEMQRLFKDAVIPERRSALAEAIADLSKGGVNWNNFYVAAAEPGYSVELTFSKANETQFISEDESGAIIIGQSADLPDPQPSRGQNFVLNPHKWSLG